MKPRYVREFPGLLASSVLIAFFPLSAAGQRAPDCGALDAATKEKIVFHAARQLRIEPVVPVIERDSFMPGSSYRQLFLTSSELKRRWVVFLSPDKRFLMEGLIDLSVDPKETDLATAAALARFIAEKRLPRRGPESAPVTVVVFSDFQCPFCAKLTVMLEKYRKQHPDQVREVFADALVAAHDWAKAAARSGLCIARQDNDAFWRFHDMLYSMQPVMSGEGLQSFVDQFTSSDRRLDATSYKGCMSSSYPEATLDAEMAESRTLDIHATPTIFVNGQKYAGFAK